MNIEFDPTEFASDEELLASLEELGDSPRAAVAAKNHADKVSVDRASTHKPGKTSSTEEKALSLLGSGVSGAQTAAALGVSESYISQLLADDNFRAKVEDARYTALQSHNERDNKYDNLEDKLLEKLDKSIALIHRPETLLKALQTVNGAKRRGSSSPDQIINQQNIVNIVLPEAIAAKFTKTSDNAVIEAGEQKLVTIQSGTLLRKAKEDTEEEEGHLIENS